MRQTTFLLVAVTHDAYAIGTQTVESELQNRLERVDGVEAVLAVPAGSSAPGQPAVQRLVELARAVDRGD